MFILALSVASFTFCFQHLFCLFLIVSSFCRRARHLWTPTNSLFACLTSSASTTGPSMFRLNQTTLDISKSQFYADLNNFLSVIHIVISERIMASLHLTTLLDRRQFWLKNYSVFSSTSCVRTFSLLIFACLSLTCRN